MRSTRERGSRWDLIPWPTQTTILLSSVAPVVVGTGVAAHYGAVPAGKSLAALGVAVSLGLGLGEILSSSETNHPTSSRLLRIPELDRIPRLALGWLALALVLGAWLAASTAWWLLAVGAVSAAIILVWWVPLTARPDLSWAQLAMVAAAELLAGWGAVFVESGRLGWLGLLPAILPASMVAALLILAKLRDQTSEMTDPEVGAVAGLTVRGSRMLFHGLLLLSLAVPLLITIPGLDGAECFLPWLLAPLAEGPLRNSRSKESILRQRAVRQTAVLLLASSALLALGVWSG